MKAVLRAHGEAGDQAALDEGVRIVPHDLAVLAGAGLGLVGVDDEIVRPAVGLLRHERPFEAGREAGAAAAAQAGRLHLVDDPVAALVEDRLGAVPGAARHGALQAPVVEAVEIGEDAVLVGEHDGYSVPFGFGLARGFAFAFAFAVVSTFSLCFSLVDWSSIAFSAFCDACAVGSGGVCVAASRLGRVDRRLRRGCCLRPSRVRARRAGRSASSGRRPARNWPVDLRAGLHRAAGGEIVEELARSVSAVRSS